MCAFVSAIDAVRARPLHTKRQADSLADRLSSFRHAMRVVKLRRVVHHEEAARLEIDVYCALRRLFGTDGHQACRAKRDERDRKPLLDFVEMIVVRRHAVTAVAIEVQADAVERHVEPFDRALRGTPNRLWYRDLRLVQPKTRHQAWHVDLTLVHHSPLCMPTD